MVKVTSDKTHAAKVINAIAENNGYCPCAVEKTKDTKCQCKEFRDMIDSGTYGECHCGLFVNMK